MWMKVDDGIADHPKIITVGPLGLALQMRAICYANKNHTDGFIPNALVARLTCDLGVDNWPKQMVEARLWEPCAGGYQLHDFLHWNMSKSAYNLMVTALSNGGKRGAKIRWKKKKTGHGLPHNLPHSLGHGLPNGLSITQESTSISTLNSLKSLKTPNPNPKEKRVREKRVLRAIADTDHPTEKHLRFAESLGIDPGPEWGKFKNYCLAHDKRYANFEAAFRNWLANAAERSHAVRHLRE